MDPFDSLSGAPYKSDYLHYNLEKFWEIRVYTNSKTLVRTGKLGPNAVEEPTVQTVERSYGSVSEASNFAKDLISTVMTRGYKYFDKKEISNVNTAFGPKSPSRDQKLNENFKREAAELDGDTIVKKVKLDSCQTVEKQQPEEQKQMEPDQELEDFHNPIVCKVNLINPDLGKKVLLMKKARESKVSCTFEGTSVILKGNEDKIQIVKRYIKELKIGVNDEPIKIKITPKIVRQGSEITTYGFDLGLLCEINENEIIVLGDEDKIETLRAYIVSKEIEDEEEVRQLNLTNVEREMDLTYNLLNQKFIIEDKLTEMKLFYEFRGEKLYLFAPQPDIDTVADLLFTLEHNDLGGPNRNNNRNLFSGYGFMGMGGNQTPQRNSSAFSNFFGTKKPELKSSGSFFDSPPSNSMSGGGSLFNNLSNGKQGGNLFGNSGGLFNNNAQSTSLFNSNPQNLNGLFSGTQSGSLFGKTRAFQEANDATTQPSLFSGNNIFESNNNLSSGSIFGGNSGSSQPVNSLFSNPQQNQNQESASGIEVNDINPDIMGDIRKKGEELGVTATYSTNKVNIFSVKDNTVNEFLSYIEEKKGSQKTTEVNTDLAEEPPAKESSQSGSLFG